MSSPLGWKLLALGALVTTLFGVLLIVGGKWVAGFSGAKLAGVLAASQTQPAVLAYANEKSDSNPDVNLGYALAYPLAMIVKVVLAPFIGML